MPSIRLNNDSVTSRRHQHDQQVAMMQIDCQVMNTKLIHVDEEAIPANLNQNVNNVNDSGVRQGPTPAAGPHQPNATAKEGGRPDNFNFGPFRRREN